MANTVSENVGVYSTKTEATHRIITFRCVSHSFTSIISLNSSLSCMIISSSNMRKHLFQIPIRFQRKIGYCFHESTPKELALHLLPCRDMSFHSPYLFFCFFQTTRTRNKHFITFSFPSITTKLTPYIRFCKIMIGWSM